MSAQGENIGGDLPQELNMALVNVGGIDPQPKTEAVPQISMDPPLPGLIELAPDNLSHVHIVPRHTATELRTWFTVREIGRREAARRVGTMGVRALFAA